MWDIKRFYNWSTFFEKRGMASGYHMSDWKFGSSSFSKSLVKKPSCNKKFENIYLWNREFPGHSGRYMTKILWNCFVFGMRKSLH